MSGKNQKMKFRHPELCKYYATMPHLMKAGGVEPDQQNDPIYRLMAMVDRFRMSEWDAGGSLPGPGDASWEPKSEELIEIIDHIIAPQHRERLRGWYKVAYEMNPAATAFRDWLEARIGETFKAPHVGAGRP